MFLVSLRPGQHAEEGPSAVRGPSLLRRLGLAAELRTGGWLVERRQRPERAESAIEGELDRLVHSQGGGEGAAVGRGLDLGHDVVEEGAGRGRGRLHRKDQFRKVCTQNTSIQLELAVELVKSN